MNNGIQIQLYLQSAQMPYAIQFPKDRTIAQLIDWIYDNFNVFFKTQNKQFIQLFSETTKSYFGYENINIFQCLGQINKDVIRVIENNQQVAQPQFSIPVQPKIKQVVAKFGDQQFQLEFDTSTTTVGEFIQFFQQQLNNNNITFQYRQLCLNQIQQNATLDSIGIVDGAEILIQKIIDVVQEKQITITINFRDGSHSSSLQQTISNMKTLGDIANTAQVYLGLAGQQASLSLKIANQTYDGPVKRAKTLFALQLADNSQIEVSTIWTGGQI